MKLSRFATGAAVCAAVATTVGLATPAKASIGPVIAPVPSITMTGTFGPGVLGVNSGGLTVPYECVAVASSTDPDGQLADAVQTTVVDSCYLAPVNSSATGASQPQQRTDGATSVAEGVANNITVLGFNLCWSGHVEYQHDSGPETSGCASQVAGVLPSGIGVSTA